MNCLLAVFLCLPYITGSIGAQHQSIASYAAAADGTNFLQYHASSLYNVVNNNADGHAVFRSVALEVPEEPKIYAVTTLRELPHEGKPWTQGFEFDKQGHLIETSGDYPPGTGSLIRVLDAATGKELQRTSAGLVNSDQKQSPRFIEGISKLGERWFASTYRDRVVLEYDADMNFITSHDFHWDGWGLARSHTGKSFLATNSSEFIMELDPETFQTSKTTVATCMGKPVAGLNELEMVDDFMGQGPRLLGNVINTRIVMVLDPETSHCTGSFILDGEQMEAQDANEHYGLHVANGIAYNKDSGTFFVTGKNWKSIFEVRLDEVSRQGDGAAHATQLRQYLEFATSSDASARLSRALR